MCDQMFWGGEGLRDYVEEGMGDPNADKRFIKQMNTLIYCQFSCSNSWIGNKAVVKFLRRQFVLFCSVEVVYVFV